MVTTLRVWLAWWVLCAALWLLLVDRIHLDELLVGAGVAAAAATLATTVRARRQAIGRVDPRWLPRVVRPAAGLVTDLPMLLRALVARGILRAPERGTFVELEYGAVGDGRRDVAHRTLTGALGSLAPNTIVVEVDEDHGRVIAHQLVHTADAARSALPLGRRP